MALLFYALGVLGLGLGSMLTGVSVVATIQAVRWSNASVGYGLAEILLRAAPGLWLILGSLLILALGRVLARLDEIARNTAPDDQ
jgi:hypothetical protein